MSRGQPIDRVVDRLASAGYSEFVQPFAVGGVKFEFAAVLGREDSLDLVLVIDTDAAADHDQIRRRVEALGRALDVVGSRRTLTVVLVGGRPILDVIQALRGVARVLPVGVPTTERDIRMLNDSLAVLLPLRVVPEQQDESSESWPARRAKLLEEYPEAAQVIEAAAIGAEEVKEALHDFISDGEPDDAQ